MQTDYRTLPPVDRPPLSLRMNTPAMTVPVVAEPMRLPVAFRDVPLGARPPALWPNQYTPHPLNGGR